MAYGDISIYHVLFFCFFFYGHGNYAEKNNFESQASRQKAGHSPAQKEHLASYEIKQLKLK